MQPTAPDGLGGQRLVSIVAQHYRWAAQCDLADLALAELPPIFSNNSDRMPRERPATADEHHGVLAVDCGHGHTALGQIVCGNLLDAWGAVPSGKCRRKHVFGKAVTRQKACGSESNRRK